MALKENWRLNQPLIFFTYFSSNNNKELLYFKFQLKRLISRHFIGFLNLKFVVQIQSCDFTHVLDVICDLFTKYL